MTREPRERDGRRPLLRFAAMRRNLVALGIGIALLAGCGDGDDPRSRRADLNAVRCPMVPPARSSRRRRAVRAGEGRVRHRGADRREARGRRAGRRPSTAATSSSRWRTGRAAGDHGLRPRADLRLHRGRRRHGDRRGRRRHLAPRHECRASSAFSRPRAPAAAPAGSCVAAWVALALAAVPLQPALQREAADESDTFLVRGSESAAARDVIDARFRSGSRDGGGDRLRARRRADRRGPRADRRGRRGALLVGRDPGDQPRRHAVHARLRADGPARPRAAALASPATARSG